VEISSRERQYFYNNAHKRLAFYLSQRLIEETQKMSSNNLAVILFIEAPNFTHSAVFVNTIRPELAKVFVIAVF
jgi:hypothetical protein